MKTKSYQVTVWEVRQHVYTVEATNGREAREKGRNAGGWPQGIVRREIKEVRLDR